MRILEIMFSTAFLAAVVRMTTPLLIAAIGDIYSEQTGVVNFALEGMMLVGCYTGFAVTYYTGLAAWGIFAAIIVGVLMGLLYSYCTVTLGCNQIVTCLGFNMAGLGITSTLYKYMFGLSTETIQVANVSTLFGHSLFFYFALLLVPVTAIVLQYTRWGLKLRALGDHPRAAATLGVNVHLNRYISVVICSAAAAIAGASITIGGLGYFQENMVAGRGFIAFSAVIFGRYNPVGTMFACLLFGFVDALQLRLQAMGTNLPYHLYLMLPYVITMLALVLIRRRSFVPRAQGQFYVKDAR
ncbi:MAG: ABC transporter permease [Bacillota bacterium]